MKMFFFLRGSISFIVFCCSVVFAYADVPGLVAALSPIVVDGRRIEVKGFPSSARHYEDVGFHSAQSAHSLLRSRRAMPDGIYQAVRPNWLTTQNADVDIQCFARIALERYREMILSKTTFPRLTSIRVEPLTLVYSAGYAGNKETVDIHARRLELHAIDSLGSSRHVVAYYLNYDKVKRGNNRVVFQVNGHYGFQPSRLHLGLKGKGGATGSPVAAIALAGHPVITYDDHDVGESSPATGKENGLYRTLANLHMIDVGLLMHFDRVDAIGISGGVERLYHFFMFNQCPIFSAYLGGFFTSTWMPLDSTYFKRGPFGADEDTLHEGYLMHFQRVDHVLTAIAKGIDVNLVNNTLESGTGKNCFVHEMLPDLRR